MQVVEYQWTNLEIIKLHGFFIVLLDPASLVPL